MPCKLCANVDWQSDPHSIGKEYTPEVVRAERKWAAVGVV